MKLPAFISAFLLSAGLALAADVSRIAPADAAKLVASGKAVLVDVREPGEWRQSGVAAPAVLLPLSDFKSNAKDWSDFLAKVGDKEVITYCRSGHRATIVANALTKKGYKTAVAGGFNDWQNAGLPVRKVGGK
jgi:rhodanese-related sulfurtransferase